ncbi:MAG: GNAT family N-acetyltransferase [Deltaproteobacteria bacterium]|nr:GNAT family N-acetyltransferase [Deltaproteobacteria bacterium]
MTDEERTPPEKIRITGLQEAQLLDLLAIETRCAAMFYEVGLSDKQVTPRNDVDLAKLTRNHDVMVAEADDRTAGYLAWADEAPGVAYLPIVLVAPAYQRFGLGTRLLRDLGEATSKLGIETVVTPCWDLAPWALSFLGVRGFQPLTGKLPDKLQTWTKRREAELLEPGLSLWWAKTDGLGTVPGLPRPS